MSSWPGVCTNPHQLDPLGIDSTNSTTRSLAWSLLPPTWPDSIFKGKAAEQGVVVAATGLYFVCYGFAVPTCTCTYVRTNMYVCMYVRMSVGRSVGLPACMPACLPACLSVCLSVRLHTVYTHVHASTCLVTYLSTFFLLSSRVFEERQRLRRLWMTVSGIPRSRDK